MPRQVCRVTEPKRIGRPPASDPWTILRVSIRESDLARLKAAVDPEAKGAASIFAREAILAKLGK
jgi:hypothetical protein